MNPGVLVYPMSSLGRQVSDQMSATTQTMYLAVGSVIVVSMPLVALIASMGTNERRREIGVLRAMGATQRYVFVLIFIETVILAIIGGLIGIAGSSLGLVLTQESVSDALNISFLWPSLSSVLAEISAALAIGVALAGIAALWPAYQASKMEPYQAIKGGQS
jgi:putative ABC transport system permease protein